MKITFRHCTRKYFLLTISCLVALMALDLAAKAQTDSYTVKIEAKADKEGRAFRFNDGKGSFKCTEFKVIASKNKTIDIAVSCTDSSTNPGRSIKIIYKGKYNDSSKGVIAYYNTNSGVLRIGNLSATINNRGEIKNFPVNGRPIEMKIEKGTSDRRPSVSFRVSDFMTREELEKLGDKGDPGGPRAARFSGGQETTGDLQVKVE